VRHTRNGVAQCAVVSLQVRRGHHSTMHQLQWKLRTRQRSGPRSGKTAEAPTQDENYYEWRIAGTLAGEARCTHAPTQRAWSEDEVPHQHGRPSYMLSGGTLHRMAEYGRWGLGTRPGFDDVKLGSIGPRKDTLLRCARADNGTRKLMAHANSAVQGVNTRSKSTATSLLG